MGIHVLPSFDHASRKPGPHLVTARRDISEQLPFELPRYSADAHSEERDGLGCMRGVAMALVIQAFFAALVFGIWELRHLLR